MSDISVEVSKLPQHIEIQEKFASINEVLSSSYPRLLKNSPTDRIYKMERLSTKMKQDLIFISKNCTPQEMAYFIMNTPPKIYYNDPNTNEFSNVAPKITIISATPEETQLATESVLLIPDADPGQLERLNTALTKFLNAPKIKDDIESDGKTSQYDRRKIWENSVMAVLTLLDETDNRPWSETFAITYGYTKYSTNTISEAVSYASTIAYKLPSSNDEKAVLQTFVDEIVDLIRSNPTNHDQRAHELTNTIRRLYERSARHNNQLFANPNPQLNNID